MLKFLLLATMISLPSLSYAMDDFEHISSSSDTYRPSGSPVLKRAKLTSNYDQLALGLLEANKKNAELSNRVETAEERLETMEKILTQNNAAPPLYKKIIPADKILATSFIFATLTFYQMYAFSGSLTLAFGSFLSSLYSCYAFLKIARDAASIAGNSPFVNKIG